MSLFYQILGVALSGECLSQHDTLNTLTGQNRKHGSVHHHIWTHDVYRVAMSETGNKYLLLKHLIFNSVTPCKEDNLDI